MTLDGPGADQLSIDGDNATLVFFIQAGGSAVRLVDLTVTGSVLEVEGVTDFSLFALGVRSRLRPPLILRSSS